MTTECASRPVVRLENRTTVCGSRPFFQGTGLDEIEFASGLGTKLSRPSCRSGDGPYLVLFIRAVGSSSRTYPTRPARLAGRCADADVAGVRGARCLPS